MIQEPKEENSRYCETESDLTRGADRDRPSIDRSSSCCNDRSTCKPLNWSSKIEAYEHQHL